MKTNLDTLFKTSDSMETTGIWMTVSEDVGFLVKRFGGYNTPKVKAATAKYYKPYARLIENGTIAPEKEKEIMTKIFVESSLMDWKGIEIDGKPAPFSKEVATEFLLSLPELAESLLSYASDSKNYKEDLGNS
jgi:hypothetical protein